MSVKEAVLPPICALWIALRIACDFLDFLITRDILCEVFEQQLKPMAITVDKKDVFEVRILTKPSSRLASN
ncbi:hypothetical protein K469DRAFT_715984 [Zopfia rhizophila CBS 207.26]|uniref:Uncharacterized protein n=1 Tax=Zopfia rhizophila CBS 207.26 TaxID=1314779 RepID=A0A6A6DL76_9PEZI|nr:hypothetical protein K469DRAFT_715984 [Zopfia rhizophila CBS 207.26]